MDLVDFDQSARPEINSLPHSLHLPLNLRVIGIQSMALSYIIHAWNWKVY